MDVNKRGEWSLEPVEDLLMVVKREGPIVRTEFEDTAGLMEALASAAMVLVGEHGVSADIRGKAAALVSAIRFPCYGICR